MQVIIAAGLTFRLGIQNDIHFAVAIEGDAFGAVFAGVNQSQLRQPLAHRQPIAVRDGKFDKLQRQQGGCASE